VSSVTGEKLIDFEPRKFFQHSQLVASTGSSNGCSQRVSVGQARSQGAKACIDLPVAKVASSFA
jgi:hypothetical protein